MWWKLAALVTVTGLLIFALIPIRTHAVKYDIDRNASGPLPSTPSLSLRQMVENMYLTPGTVVLIVLIVAIAAYLALRIIRAG